MNNMFAPSKFLLLIGFFYLMVEGRSHVKIEEQYRKVTFLVKFFFMNFVLRIYFFLYFSTAKALI